MGETAPGEGSISAELQTNQPPVVVCPACTERSSHGLLFCPHDGARLQPADTIAGAATTRKAPPSVVGRVIAERYRILRKLGEGGMGEVYEAEHVYIDKRVAIKTLHAEAVGDPAAIARFQQEAHAASTIGHENIVAIDDFGTLPEGGVYMAMEHLEGASLGDRMRAGPLARKELLDYVLQLCRGLSAAHEKGIIHRDMKPENVFLARRGGRVVVKILDFGIAKVLHPTGVQAQLTQNGAVFGTPYYMSPEQALGRPLDGRADVYAVGVMLYELFAGRVPFEGDTFMAILSQHITSAPPPPSSLAPERQIPPAFERLILKAMAKEPGDRFPSMVALADALLDAEARAGEQTYAAPTDHGAAPIELAELPPNRAGIGTLAITPADPRRRAALAFFAVVIAFAIAAGTVAVLRAPSQGPANTATIKPATDPSAPLTPDANGAVEIVLDSIPSGAKVLAKGRVIAETPEAIKLLAGKPLEVILHKDGYVARQLSLDPNRDGHKVIVKLERESSRHPAPLYPYPK